MSDWLGTINKLIERIPFLVAGCLAAASVLVLRKSEFLQDLKEPESLVAMVGIFCGWATLVLWVDGVKKAAGLRLKAWWNRRAEVEKLQILTEDQRKYLVYAKSKKRRQFQGRYHDETLKGLCRMGLLLQHESTGNEKARFEIPVHIWNELKEVAPQVALKLPEEPPWEAARRRFG